MGSMAHRAYRRSHVADRVAWGYLWRLPPHVDRDEIRQVAQIAAWQAEQEFDGRGNLDAWITQCVKWRLVDESRNELKHISNCTPFDADDLESLDRWLSLHCQITPCVSPDTADIYERADTYSKALHALPPVTRGVVERTLAGAAGVEIAQELGVTPARIWQHLDAAKRVFADQHR